MRILPSDHGAATVSPAGVFIQNAMCLCDRLRFDCRRILHPKTYLTKRQRLPVDGSMVSASLQLSITIHSRIDLQFVRPSCHNDKFPEIGKGLWENATGGPPEFQIYASDPEAQAAACLVVMKGKEKDIILGARLTLENGKLYEIEAPGAVLPYDTKSGWASEEKVYPKPK